MKPDNYFFPLKKKEIIQGCGKLRLLQLEVTSAELVRLSDPSQTFQLRELKIKW